MPSSSSYPVLQRHVADWRETNTGSHNVLDGGSLPKQRVDHGRTLRHQRRLAEITQNREDRSERQVFGIALLLDLDARAKFTQNGQIQNQRRRKQRIYAGIVDHERVVTAEHDLARVLVHGAFAVTCRFEGYVRITGW